ncbi:jg6273 [Pararge aegeria aegeria]|uniref:Jg6273 protein n=1 Tax=Pararge aegeria aegeria TaxID=348720 RepID=A0A8S4SQJ9_9NEOP|nr:jg6273 [Pararge aegeria aegeria]
MGPWFVTDEHVPLSDSAYRYEVAYKLIRGITAITLTGEPMVVGVPRCWNGDPAQVYAVLVGPQRGGQTTSNESLGAAGNKWPRTVDFGTLYKRLVQQWTSIG